MTAAQTRAQFTKWKIKVVYYPGWDTRGRPGGVAPVGIVKHHTGGGSGSDSYLYFLFVKGRPDEGIPGPLCNVATAPDGTLHVGAIGRANHAGTGSQTTLNHVKAEDYNGYSSELHPGADGVNGNAVYYGDEIIYTGATAPTDAAYRTSILHAAAICDFYGWSALSVIAHREHTSRKDDPGHVAMNQFRTDLAAVLRYGPDCVWAGKTPHAPATPGNTSKPPTTDGFTVAEADRVIAHIDKIESSEGIEGGRYAQIVNENRNQTKAVLDALAVLTKAVNDLAAKLP